ncbi:MAG: glycine cleavage system protein H [Deltaproteobacteria bacterium]|nr:glycine cleavage system protein H [Deltaproteobacteria bacterium]
MTNFAGEFFYYDLFATKGIEYIIVIGFLLALVGFWKWVSTSPYAETLVPAEAGFARWFLFPENLYYHRGHTWAKEEEGYLKVGIDDFAQKLVGRPEAIELPSVGEKLDQGGRAIKFRVDSKAIEMVSPVKGEVVDINEEVLKNPSVLTEDPYEKGWLIKVRPDDTKRNLRNLISGSLAKVWFEESVEALKERISGRLGYLLQDGGVPVSGMAKMIDEKNWDRICREFFLTED